VVIIFNYKIKVLTATKKYCWSSNNQCSLVAISKGMT
jgi:hypothetical protein